MLQEANAGSTPPCCKQQGTKQQHSPWSAPRERKRRSKPARPAHLSSIEEGIWTSPPKRANNGAGWGPGGAARAPTEPFERPARART